MVNNKEKTKGQLVVLAIMRVQSEPTMLTEMVELGVLVPYPEEGRDANDQRRPSVLVQRTRAEWSHLRVRLTFTKVKFVKTDFEDVKCVWFPRLRKKTRKTTMKGDSALKNSYKIKARHFQCQNGAK